MKMNPWINRFDDRISDADLDQRIEIRAKAIEIGSGTPKADAELLRASLKRIFLSNHNIRNLLRELIGAARSHSELHFSSEEQYLKGLYSKSPWGYSTSPAICLTGLAGVGKTDLLLALLRALAQPTEISVTGLSNIPLVSAWPLSLTDGAGMNAILRPHLQPLGVAANSDIEQVEVSEAKDWNLPTLLKLSRRRAWRDGVSLLWVDEFQFISQGAQANAKATSILLQLLGIGPRQIFCANYSLVHKLKKRNHEERQRLLSCPLILDPEVCSSAEWIALINEYKAVAPDVFNFNVNETERLIHQYTFGIKRLVVDLLVNAYLMARQNGEDVVSTDHIKQAYISTAYTCNREDVEKLWRQSYENTNISDDLFCPFDHSHESKVIVAAKKAIEHFVSRIEDKLLDASLSPTEALAAQTIDSSQDTKKETAKVLSMAKRSKVTKESLLAAASEMFNVPPS